VTAQLNPRGDVAVLVPAAGMGERLGPGAPKALRQIGGVPLLVHALRRLAAAPSVGAIVLAAPPADVDAVTALANAVLRGPYPPGGPSLTGPALSGVGFAGSITVVAGGATRQASVAAALAAAPSHLEIVLVHDAARALAPSALVESVAAAVRQGREAVVPVLPVVDTVKEVSAGEIVVGTVDRSRLRVVQTPQGFRRRVLTEAHAAAAGEVTDDAGLVEKLGVAVHCVPGCELAMKITRPFDLVVAEHLLVAESSRNAEPSRDAKRSAAAERSGDADIPVTPGAPDG
jgi:2-C-methyl-D-erythritol 4-phosphate cytidylyltransferase